MKHETLPKPDYDRISTMEWELGIPLSDPARPPKCDAIWRDPDGEEFRCIRTIDHEDEMMGSKWDRGKGSRHLAKDGSFWGGG